METQISATIWGINIHLLVLILAYNINIDINRLSRTNGTHLCQPPLKEAAHQSGKATSKQFAEYPTVEWISYKRKAFKTADNFSRSGCPSKYTPRSDHAMFRGITKMNALRFYKPQLAERLEKQQTVPVPTLHTSCQAWFWNNNDLGWFCSHRNRELQSLG